MMGVLFLDAATSIQPGYVATSQLLLITLFKKICYLKLGCLQLRLLPGHDSESGRRFGIWSLLIPIYNNLKYKKEPLLLSSSCNGCSNDLFSRTVSSQVFSALVSLTSVFGMRTGGTSPLASPQWYISGFLLGISIFLCTYIVHFFQLPVKLFTRQIDNCIDFFLSTFLA